MPQSQLTITRKVSSGSSWSEIYNYILNGRADSILSVGDSIDCVLKNGNHIIPYTPTASGLLPLQGVSAATTLPALTASFPASQYLKLKSLLYALKSYYQVSYDN